MDAGTVERPRWVAPQYDDRYSAERSQCVAQLAAYFLVTPGLFQITGAFSAL
jgi:hypothetical protein